MLLSTFKKDDYYESSLPSYDRRILDILNNYSGADSNVCSTIKENITETLYEDGDIFLSTGTQTPSTNSLFVGSCVLVNKDKIGTFNLFSCYLKDQPFCPYEINKWFLHYLDQ